MGFLDKLKPTPRWKHADPAVRLEAVRELDDPVELAILAETDTDARVRRAAIPRTVDPAVLGRVAAGDADPETRDRAADRLVALATAGGDDARRGGGRGDADRPAPAVGDRAERRAAKRCAPKRWRARPTRAALSSIARHAKHEATAMAALERLADRDELIDVAQNARPQGRGAARVRAAARAARSTWRCVRAIETRTSQKAVARRARAIIQDAEAAEAARLAADEERRRRETRRVRGGRAPDRRGRSRRAPARSSRACSGAFDALDGRADAAVRDRFQAATVARRSGDRAARTRDPRGGRTGAPARRGRGDTRGALRARGDARRRRRARAIGSDRRRVAIAHAAGGGRPGGRPSGGAVRQGGGCVPEAARAGRPAGRDARGVRDARVGSRRPCCPSRTRARRWPGGSRSAARRAATPHVLTNALRPRRRTRRAALGRGARR